MNSLSEAWRRRRFGLRRFGLRRFGLRNLHSLSTPVEFEREFARERIRCTRRSFPFCVLHIQLNQPDADGKNRRVMRQQIAAVLHRHTRTTDYKSELSAGKFAVLMTDTAEMGGRSACDRLANQLIQLGVRVVTQLNVHDPQGFSDPPTSGGSVVDERYAMEVNSYVSRHPDSAAEPVFGSAVGVERRGEFEHHGENYHGVNRFSHTNPVGQDRDRDTETELPLRAPRTVASALKRSVDIVGALVGLVLASPIIAAAMVMIRLGDGQSPVFKQTREGRFGRPFTIYKLRTMQIDAEQSQAQLRSLSHRDGPAFKISNDPRVTRVGQFLRQTCLDELPQLINVLLGDMSLVGPRPLPWHESRACHVWHRRRLEVRPGMTCYWQINKSSAITFDDWMRLDLQYLSRAGFFEDLRLIARTVTVPMSGRGSD